ncbi:molecular chaperone (small heat shock protein) [Cenarchaeum symbiosum A]|uniref:Molecular chaperone (Small heat shock protein) n=1 Tax=Cenarchaeum symbiosum (strain A) TaxID=414004 RepID=A0RXR5_CENSY|nr:molecular chaperone (small heat shock protein) [Cenarchaeum symbiosum A]
MGLIKSMAREMAREFGSKSREFYEFVLPPVDIYMGPSELKVLIDIPGFKKDEIRLSISRNILHISAERRACHGRAVCAQRPKLIDKSIRLPIYVKRDEEPVAPAKYEDGVLTLIFPVTGRGKSISIE